MFARLLLLLSIVARPVAAQEAPARTSGAVDRALHFLKNMQEKDGSWRLGRRPGDDAAAGAQGHPAITSLAVLAFLSAGHLPGEGPYGDVVEKGIEWVVACQSPEGIFSKEFHADMYNQGICTLMLAETVGMTNAALAKKIRPGLTKAAAILLKAQRLEKNPERLEKNGPRGGWRYSISGDDADLSVSGWQLMALRAARNAGCDVPAERIDLAIDYVLRCREATTGAFCYMPGVKPTLACTGTGLLSLELSGKLGHRSFEAVKAGSYILRNPPVWGSEHFLYATYYCAQGMFQLGQNYWAAFRPHLYGTLLEKQQDNGAWLGNEGMLSPVYSTSMAVLALTVEYRFLPIYQRHEEPEKGAGDKRD